MDFKDPPGSSEISMKSEASPTAFVGLSHLGIVSSIAWASFGRPVIGYDLNPDPIEKLVRGTIPLYEPGLEELFAKARGWMSFSKERESLSRCRLVILSLDVPTAADNTSDLSPLLTLIGNVVPVLQDGVVLVVMSQVSPGFTRGLGEQIRALRPGFPFSLYYLAETLIIGRAVERALRPECFIVGCEDPSEPLAVFFEEGLGVHSCPILRMRYESAELTKSAINVYLTCSVTYTNILADLCAAVNADWGEMVPALKLDPRIGTQAYLRPSLGISGGNLERDLITLRELCYRHGIETTYMDTLMGLNNRRYHWVLHMLQKHVFQDEPFPSIAIWGLTYKKNTRLLKNSPAIRLIKDLGQRAQLRAWDPVISAENVELPAEVFSSRESALEGADGLVIMTDWDEFQECDPKAFRLTMRRPVIIDCVGVLESRRAQLAGIRYISMGRSPTE